MNTKLTVELDEQKRVRLAALLFNAWTAEYTMRVSINNKDDEYLRKALRWTYPQLYLSALFSAKAVMLTWGSTSENENTVCQAMNIAANRGFYGKEYSAGGNPYLDARQHRIGVTSSQIPAPANIADYQQGLIDKVEAIALIHERHIIGSIGKTAYLDLLTHIPGPFKDDFLLARTTKLFRSINEVSPA